MLMKKVFFSVALLGLSAIDANIGDKLGNRMSDIDTKFGDFDDIVNCPCTCNVTGIDGGNIDGVVLSPVEGILAFCVPDLYAKIFLYFPDLVEVIFPNFPAVDLVCAEVSEKTGDCPKFVIPLPLPDFTFPDGLPDGVLPDGVLGEEELPAAEEPAGETPLGALRNRDRSNKT